MEKDFKPQEQAGAFLTLTTTSINGWCIAMCPEFEVSACGADPERIEQELFDMIKRNAQMHIDDEITGKKSTIPLEWSKTVIENRNNIRSLFRSIHTKKITH